MTDERIFAYLLNELPEEEAERFEEECFAAENWPEQLNSVEEDLIDAYLRDELTPEQRRRFEQNYATTEARRARVAWSAALLRQVDAFPVEDEPFVPSPRAEPTWAERLNAFWSSWNWGLRAGVAVGAIAVMAGAIWFSMSPTPESRTIITPLFTISIHNTRAVGVQGTKISRPRETDTLRILLQPPEQLNAGERYRVELFTDNGEVSRPKVTGQEREAISVDVPAAQLPRGQYYLKLVVVKPDGTEERVRGSYFFMVE